MTVSALVPNQYWTVDNFFEKQQFQQIKSIYRENRMPFQMVYDNRLLTDYNTTPELQELVAESTSMISDLVGAKLQPQVAYVSIDLPGSRIMMHRLHTDIAAQVQIPMGEFHSDLGYSICTDSEINTASSEDYRPIRAITKANTVCAEYSANKANVFYNQPRAFVGMLEAVPNNHIREVLVMSYQLLRS